MEQADLILTLTRPLDDRNVTYMATGSVASTFYGVPRFTHDIDLAPPEYVILRKLEYYREGQWSVIGDQFAHNALPREADGVPIKK